MKRCVVCNAIVINDIEICYECGASNFVTIGSLINDG